MNPDDGGIEAMVSYPGFQPAVFQQRMTESELERRFGASNAYPLLNRAMQGSTRRVHLQAVDRALGVEARTGRLARSDRHRQPTPTGARRVDHPVRRGRPRGHPVPVHNWTSANLGFMNMAGALAEVLRHRLLPDGLRVLEAVSTICRGPTVRRETMTCMRATPPEGPDGIGFGRETTRSSVRARGPGSDGGVEARHPRATGCVPRRRLVPRRLRQHDDRAGRLARDTAPDCDRLFRLQ